MSCSLGESNTISRLSHRFEYVEKLPKTENQSDLRLVRIGVAVARSPALRIYYCNRESIGLAFRYIGVPSPQAVWAEMRAIEGIDGFVRLLEFLQNANLLLPIFDYTINEMIGNPRHSRMITNAVDEFSVFIRELSAAGFEYDTGRKRLIATVGHETESQQIISRLDSMLSKLDPKLVETHKGAWDALQSNSRDQSRQTIASARELLNDVITRLGSGATRKEKIRSVMKSESRTEVMEAFANLVDALYGFASGEYHTESNYDDALFVLTTTEQTLFHLLNAAGF